LDAAEDDYEDVGPLRFAQGTAAEPARSTRKIVVGVGTLVVIAIIGLVFGIRAITKSNDTTTGGTTRAGAATSGSIGGGSTAGTGQSQPPAPQKIPLTADMVRIVDPPKGSRTDEGEAKFTVDNDPDTAWETQRFKQSNFGNLKAGMGVLINLGTPRTVADVRVETSAPGVTMDVRTGTKDPGDTSAGDDQIVKTYKKISDSDSEKTDGPLKVFDGFNEDSKYQYILVFLTDLPPADDGRGGYKVSVTHIEVYGN
jgi:hypothetical protein